MDSIDVPTWSILTREFGRSLILNPRTVALCDTKISSPIMHTSSPNLRVRFANESRSSSLNECSIVSKSLRSHSE